MQQRIRSRQAAVVTGSGAGALQMSATFALQIHCNKTGQGGERKQKNRLTVVGLGASSIRLRVQWACCGPFSNANCDGEKFHKIDSIHVVSLALGRALSLFWASH